MSDMSDRLREARKLHFGTVKEAAEALGISYPTYAGHENGADGFGYDSAIAYARKFKITLDWLIAGKGKGLSKETDLIPIAKGEDEIRNLISHIEGINDEQIEILTSVALSYLPASARHGQTQGHGQSSSASRRHEEQP